MVGAAEHMRSQNKDSDPSLICENKALSRKAQRARKHSNPPPSEP
jgi:hypothetical protein